MFRSTGNPITGLDLIGASQLNHHLVAAGEFREASNLKSSVWEVVGIARTFIIDPSYHWDMLKQRPICAAAVRRKRVVTLQKLSTRKVKPISLCHRQTSRPPSKKHRSNQNPESAQVPARGTSRLSHCIRHFILRAILESRATWLRKFRIQRPLTAQQKNRKSSIAAPLLPQWT